MFAADLQALGLAEVDCPACGGDGALLQVGAPGVYSAAQRTFLPSEALLECPACRGQGWLEVCSGCLEPVDIRDGLEVCGCATLAWRRAA